MTTVGNRLMARRGSEGNTITEIAMGRIGDKPEQERTKQPCPYAMSTPVVHNHKNKRLQRLPGLQLGATNYQTIWLNVWNV
jgi:hypothetical protein